MSESDLVAVIREELAKQTAIFKRELEELRREIKEIGKRTEQKIFEVEKRVDIIEGDILELKRRSRKNNVVINGLDLEDADFVNSSIATLNDILQTDVKLENIDNIYKLGKSKTAPIKVEFKSYLVKSKVTSKRSRLKGTNIYINDDLCEEDRQKERILIKHLKEARQKNYRAYRKGWNIYINGEKYTLNDLIEFGDQNIREDTNENETEVEQRSAPSSPFPVTRSQQLVRENTHIQFLEQSKIQKEITGIERVLKGTSDLEQKRKTRLNSSGKEKAPPSTAASSSKTAKKLVK